MLSQLKYRIKKIIWKKKNIHNLTAMGRNFRINRVSVGKNTYGPVSVLEASPEECFVKIGNYCGIAQGVKFLLGVEHNLNTISTYPFKTLKFGMGAEAHAKGNIIVEDDVWIGEDATICSGVKIGQGAVIGANSVVTKDVEPYSIVAGNPAKIIRYRFNEKLRKKLCEIEIVSLLDSFSKDDISLLYSELTEDLLSEIIQKKGF